MVIKNALQMLPKCKILFVISLISFVTVTNKTQNDHQKENELQKAIQLAAAGNYSQAKHAMESIMSDPQAQKLLKELGR